MSIYLTQVCQFKLYSHSHTSDVMHLDLLEVINLPSEGTETNLQYTYTIESFSQNITYLEWGNKTWEIVGFKMKMERIYLQYIISYYFPSLIFVVVSWISFVIPPGEVFEGRFFYDQNDHPGTSTITVPRK